MNRRDALRRLMVLAAGSAAGSVVKTSNSSVIRTKPGEVQKSMPTIAPPDPNTRTPRYRMPNGACDSHCHIFGPAEKHPYAPDRTYTPPDAPLEMFRALHEKIGVQRAVIVNASAQGLDNRVPEPGSDHGYHLISICSIKFEGPETGLTTDFHPLFFDVRRSRLGTFA